MARRSSVSKISGGASDPVSSLFDGTSTYQVGAIADTEYLRIGTPAAGIAGALQASPVALVLRNAGVVADAGVTQLSLSGSGVYAKPLGFGAIELQSPGGIASFGQICIDSVLPVAGQVGPVAYAPELRKWVMGLQGTTALAVSNDGFNWTSVTVPATAVGYFCMAYSPSQLVWAAAGLVSSASIRSLTGGTTWVAGGTFASTGSKYTMLWVPQLDLFVVTGGADLARISTSPTGSSWTARTTPTGDFRGLVYDPVHSVLIATAVNANGAQVATSTNGTTWTTRTTPTDASGINEYISVACSLTTGRVYANHGTNGGTGITNRKGMYSDDGGLTWTLVPDFGDNTGVGYVTWCAGINLFVRHHPSLGEQTSTDGINWTRMLEGASPFPISVDRPAWDARTGILVQPGVGGLNILYPRVASYGKWG